MTEQLFIPWQESFVRGKEYRSLSSKAQHSYKDNYFKITRSQNVKWWNKPYFAITNESSTVKFFLDAVVKSGDYKEAAVYMSKSSSFGLEDLKSIFAGMNSYKYARKLNACGKADFVTVTISPVYTEKRKNSLLHVKMVYEPDRYGKWKIYKIEESDC